jgi:hypothetical protein
MPLSSNGRVPFHHFPVLYLLPPLRQLSPHHPRLCRRCDRYPRLCLIILCLLLVREASRLSCLVLSVVRWLPHSSHTYTHILSLSLHTLVHTLVHTRSHCSSCKFLPENALAAGIFAGQSFGNMASVRRFFDAYGSAHTFKVRYKMDSERMRFRVFCVHYGASRPVSRGPPRSHLLKKGCRWTVTLRTVHSDVLSSQVRGLLLLLLLLLLVGILSFCISVYL